jgi:two-component system sensor histidine kinase KdpD
VDHIEYIFFGHIRGEAPCSEWGCPMVEMSKRWVWPGLTATALVVLTTSILLAIYLASQSEHLIFGYFIPLIFVAVRYGSVPAIITAVACDLCAAYFLYPPDFSFAISDPLQVAEIGFFSLLALAASQFIGGLADDERLRQQIASFKKAA